jgi:sterol desaturase/sphingolipid hydroxylase (fatty acid hydroxylase superfamily)
MYEHRDQEPLSRRHFMLRMIRHGLAASVIVAGSLVLGMWGYHLFARESWLDAFVNAAMLLGGMGQVGTIDSESGRLFSGLFALYAGMVFLVLIATILTPVIHRVLHRFHWEADRKRAMAGRRKPE